MDNHILPFSSNHERLEQARTPRTAMPSIQQQSRAPRATSGHYVTQQRAPGAAAPSDLGANLGASDSTDERAPRAPVGTEAIIRTSDHRAARPSGATVAIFWVLQEPLRWLRPSLHDGLCGGTASLRAPVPPVTRSKRGTTDPCHWRSSSRGHWPT